MNWFRRRSPSGWEWPVHLHSRDGIEPPITLRPLRAGDSPQWDDVRRNSRAYVSPWEPTAPSGRPNLLTFAQYVRDLDRAAASRTSRPFCIEVRGVIVGQMSLYGIVHVSQLSGAVGYWVAEQAAGQGIATRSLAMLCDHAFGDLGLHRVEVNIRPENAASLRVVEHLGFRFEGVRERYLHIAGEWADHRSYALTIEELAGQPVWRRRSSPGIALRHNDTRDIPVLAADAPEVLRPVRPEPTAG